MKRFFFFPLLLAVCAFAQPSVSTIQQEGSFSSDIRQAINNNFSSLLTNGLYKDANGNMTTTAPIFAGAVTAGTSSASTAGLFIGDSRTVGFNGTSNTPYTNFITLQDAVNIQNLGISGQTCQTILGNITTYTSKYAYNATRNAAVVWCGTNDMANGATAAQTFTYYSAICRALKQAGFRVVAVTEISRTGIDSKKDQFNQSVRQSWRSFADSLADLGADTTIGIDGQYANGTYFYTDGTHPLATVYQTTIPQLISAAFNNAISGFPVNLPFLATNTVANGTFASGTSWSQVGVGWTISGGVASMNGSTGSQLLFQTGLITAGNWYAVTFTITARTAGTMHVGFGGMSNQQGIAPSRFVVGTYTEILYADSTTNGNLVFDGEASFNGSIDDVSLQLISSSRANGVLCSSASGFTFRAASACQ